MFATCSDFSQQRLEHTIAGRVVKNVRDNGSVVRRESSFHVAMREICKRYVRVGRLVCDQVLDIAADLRVFGL